MKNEAEKKYLEIKVHSWEAPYIVDPKDFIAKKDDWIIFESEHGIEGGKVTKNILASKVAKDSQVYPARKIADLEDLKKVQQLQEDKKIAIKICKQYIRKYELPMKLVDASVTFDEKKIIFAFTADVRVDFRSLVKDLINYFQKAVRLQQVGIRDEVKQIGGLGPCGREICCASFLKGLGNITTDLARIQQVQQRGSDRLSGACGRLKCCLNYEAEGYKSVSQHLPPLDSQVKTDKGMGRVIEWNVIKHSVLVRVDRETVVEKFYGCGACKCTGCAANKYFK